MIEELTVKNLALVDDITLRFTPGLNVITGETGAGKSMVIGALSFVMGDRPGASARNSDSPEVSARFNHQNSTSTISRKLGRNGRTSAWLNEKKITLNELRETAGKWIDLTAQREGTSLLDPSTHLLHLDKFGNHGDLLSEVEEHYSGWEILSTIISKTEKELALLSQGDELAYFQMNEISAFNPVVGEQSNLDNEVRLLENSESLLIEYEAAILRLDQGDQTTSDQIAEILGRLERFREIDDALPSILDKLNETVSIIRESALELTDLKNRIILDDELLTELRDRQNTLGRLIEKYGGSEEKLHSYWKELRERDYLREELENELNGLHQQLKVHLKSWESHLVLLNKKREKAGKAFEKMMIKGLKTIGIDHPKFQIQWNTPTAPVIEFPSSGLKSTSSSGWDFPEFHISFNPGQPLQPVQEVASGGELSRIMLLLKSFHSSTERSPSAVFDEIDTGISGKTARQVGLRLLELARDRQIILVTHLPQIASLANNHIAVEKTVSDKNTTVNARSVAIGQDDQVEEIAKLLGGEVVSESSRVAAKELIENH